MAKKEVTKKTEKKVTSVTKPTLSKVEKVETKPVAEVVKPKFEAGEYIFIHTYWGKRGKYQAGVKYNLTTEEAEFFKKEIQKC